MKKIYYEKPVIEVATLPFADVILASKIGENYIIDEEIWSD